MKKVIFKKEAREKLLMGIEVLSEAVITTLGPKGRNVALDRGLGVPNVIHDGVSVAKEISLDDPFENMGAQLVKEAASKTNDRTGDGTTTATLLAYTMAKEGNKYVEEGHNPMTIIKGINKAVSLVIEELKKQAVPVKTPKEMENVATISAANEEIGKVVVEVVDKVGKDGVIDVQPNEMPTIDVEYKEGMSFDEGWLSPYFITNPDKLEAELNDPYILITDKQISLLLELEPILQKLVEVSKQVVILASSVDNEALNLLVVNKARQVIQPLAIKAPMLRRSEFLEDIAILTGGTVISQDSGMSFDKVELEHLGRAEKVRSSEYSTQIIGGKGEKEKINTRIKVIRRQLKEASSETEKGRLQQRLAKFTNGVAVIKVGAPSESEMKEKRERVIDAVGAVTSALEEGIVAGGGVALLQARHVLSRDDVGQKIVFDALAMPMQTILKNAGVDAYDRMIFAKGKGMNVETGEVVDMIDAGIVDPVKVTRMALEAAASVASIILTTDVLVGESYDSKK